MSSCFPKHIVEKYEPLNRYTDLYEALKKMMING